MIPRQCIRPCLCWLAAMSIFGNAGAQAPPEPLTLEAALATAGNDAHYEMVELEQQIVALAAELGIERGQQGFSLDLVGRLSKVGPSDYDPDTEDNDSAASLVLTKPLYNFGLRDARENYLGLQLLALETRKKLLLDGRRLKIMERYFEVLNADNDFRAETEAMAIAYNRWERAVDRQGLGRESEIEVLRVKTEYDSVLQRRSLVMHRQRLSRAMLAEAMGFPENLPSELVEPRIEARRDLPRDFEALVQQALAHSAEARLADANSRAAQAAIGIAENDDGPSLDFELQVSEYARDSRLRDDWSASLLFEIPLYSGASAEKVKLAQARHRIALANQQQQQSNLRLEVLELWQRIQQLGLEIEAHEVQQLYRERYLDRSRAEYELEFKTDLGDSMALYTRGNADRLRALFEYELAYHRLVLLVGEAYLDQPGLSQ